MKKIFIVILIALLFASFSYATEVVYRISSNEVVYVGDNPPLLGPLFGSLTDPTMTDGSDFRGPPDNELRVIGYSKINDNGTIRNATQNEIDAFYEDDVNRYNIVDRDRARDYFENDPMFKKIMKAFASIMLDELNRNRTWQRDFKDAVAATTSLADFQNRVANLQGLPDKDLVDLVNAIKGRISEND